MPRLRRLTGPQVIAILEELGFEVVRTRGSHVQLRRTVDGESQHLTVAVHGSKTLALGTLRSIYRQLLRFFSEEEIRPYFYAD